MGARTHVPLTHTGAISTMIERNRSRFMAATIDEELSGMETRYPPAED